MDIGLEFNPSNRNHADAWINAIGTMKIRYNLELKLMLKFSKTR